MILVDTSVWIEILNAGLRPAEKDFQGFVTCGPVVQEVLQGFRPSAGLAPFRVALLALPLLSDPIPARRFIEAAEIYREGRRRGITLRSATDCLIAAIAIESEVAVWHRDRDFSLIARYTRLREYQPA